MWKSLDEKWELVPYDKQKRPVKVKGSKWVMGGSVLVFVLSSYIATNLSSGLRISERPIPVFYHYIPLVAALLGAVACLGFAFLKWKKNDKELDIGLIFMAVFLIIFGDIASLILK